MFKTTFRLSFPLQICMVVSMYNPGRFVGFVVFGLATVGVVGGAAGCSSDDRGSEAAADEGIDGGGIPGIDSTTTGEDGDSGGGDDADSGGDSTSGGGLRLDAPGGGGSGGNCEEGGPCPVCEVPEHVPCDDTASATPGQALGLGCPGELGIVPTFNGAPAAISTATQIGGSNVFTPREGSRFVVLGTGPAADLDSPGGCTADLDTGLPLGCAANDPGSTLPNPLDYRRVGTQTCAENPALVGTGDCSNTLQDQFEAGLGGLGLCPGANDYGELRFTVQVPMGASSLSYDFAFFSLEYPEYYGSEYNDMYVGWIESQDWTGNISFDDTGRPISLNAGFLDFKDAQHDWNQGDPACLNTNCSAPELAGTCMQGHAATRWLSSSVGVVPGETITLVFAIYDMGDSILDSYVLLDNFQWGCDGDTPPTTTPVG